MHNNDLGNASGRLVYVEPNDFAFMGINNISGDNIVFRPEDLKMGVDFQVILPKRDYICQTDYDKIVYNIVNPLSDKGSMGNEYRSFFQGKHIEINNADNYELTTDYINASYSEIRDGRHSDSESLGIKTINVKYDSTFYPIVTVTIVDVRGNALMAPSEYEYTENLKATRYYHTSKASESFFKSLFHFPYPRYILTMKGFYGQSITYTLAVQSFSTAFDSKTGDFNVTIKLIGHLYGVLGDIPLNALLVSPYIQYIGDKKNDDELINPLSKTLKSINSGKVDDDDSGGKKKTQEISKVNKVDDMINSFWDYSRFLCTDGTTQLPTFVQFMDNMAEIQKEYNEATEQKDVDMTKERQQIDDSTTLLSLYDNFIQNPYVNVRVKVLNSPNTSTLFFFMNGMKAGITPEINKDAKDKLEKAINDYNKKYNTDLKIYEEGTSLTLKEPIFGKYSSADEFIRQNPDYLNTYHIKKESLDTIYSNIAWREGEEVKNFPYGIIVHNDVFTKKVREASKDAQSKIDEKTKELNKKRAEINAKLLGFDPTIRNVYRDIFAHVDCFIAQFYNLLGLINEQVKNKERLISKCIGYKTDMSEEYTDSHESLAPFPMVYREVDGKNEVIYPGDSDNEVLKNLAEVKFIDALCEAIFNTQNRIRSSEFKNMPKYSITHNTYIIQNISLGSRGGGPKESNSELNFIPTLYTDIFYDKNPFSYISSCVTGSESDAVTKILCFELNRLCGYEAMMSKYDEAEWEERIKQDAQNFISLYTDVSYSLKETMRSTTTYNTIKHFIDTTYPNNGNEYNVTDTFNYNTSKRVPVNVTNINGGNGDLFINKDFSEGACNFMFYSYNGKTSERIARFRRKFEEFQFNDRGTLHTDFRGDFYPTASKLKSSNGSYGFEGNFSDVKDIIDGNKSDVKVKWNDNTKKVLTDIGCLKASTATDIVRRGDKINIIPSFKNKVGNISDFERDRSMNVDGSKSVLRVFPFTYENALKFGSNVVNATKKGIIRVPYPLALHYGLLSAISKANKGVVVYPTGEGSPTLTMPEKNIKVGGRSESTNINYGIAYKEPIGKIFCNLWENKINKVYYELGKQLSVSASDGNFSTILRNIYLLYRNVLYAFQPVNKRKGNNVKFDNAKGLYIFWHTLRKNYLGNQNLKFEYGKNQKIINTSSVRVKKVNQNTNNTKTWEATTKWVNPPTT